MALGSPKLGRGISDNPFLTDKLPAEHEVARSLAVWPGPATELFETEFSHLKNGSHALSLIASPRPRLQIGDRELAPKVTPTFTCKG